MRKQQLITPFLILMVFIGMVLPCCNREPGMAKVSDGELNIQAMRIGKLADDVAYAVRIYPKKEILEANKAVSKNMMYGTDSCFYLTYKKSRIYPVSITCIANGIPGSFEYLVSYEGFVLPEPATRNLFYKDKYINKKDYQLSLK